MFNKIIVYKSITTKSNSNYSKVFDILNLYHQIRV